MKHKNKTDNGKLTEKRQTMIIQPRTKIYLQIFRAKFQVFSLKAKKVVYA